MVMIGHSGTEISDAGRSVFIYRGTGKGAITPATKLSPAWDPVAKIANAAFGVGDFNADGTVDVVLVDRCITAAERPARRKGHDAPEHYSSGSQ